MDHSQRFKQIRDGWNAKAGDGRKSRPIVEETTTTTTREQTNIKSHELSWETSPTRQVSIAPDTPHNISSNSAFARLFPEKYKKQFEMQRCPASEDFNQRRVSRSSPVTFYKSHSSAIGQNAHRNESDERRQNTIYRDDKYNFDVAKRYEMDSGVESYSRPTKISWKEAFDRQPSPTRNRDHSFERDSTSQYMDNIFDEKHYTTRPRTISEPYIHDTHVYRETIPGELNDLFVKKTPSEEQIRSVPVEHHPLNFDPDPEIVYKDNPERIVYVQKVGVKYLQPPTPPPPGPLIIKEVRSPPPPEIPPLIVTPNQPLPARTPSPIIIREEPPIPPEYQPPKIITKTLPPPPAPPRRVIVKRIPPLPEKPRPIVIEKWLPYKQPQRPAILYEKAPQIQPVPTRNIIVQYEPARVKVMREVQNVGLYRVDPATYRAQYGTQLRRTESIRQVLQNIGCGTDLINNVTVRNNTSVPYHPQSTPYDNRSYLNGSSRYPHTTQHTHLPDSYHTSTNYDGRLHYIDRDIPEINLNYQRANINSNHNVQNSSYRMHQHDSQYQTHQNNDVDYQLLSSYYQPSQQEIIPNPYNAQYILQNALLTQHYPNNSRYRQTT
ncbi:unnamed protein product [Didymodactylos carnosus]|uniref:Uncharacterized protein n=1 Tax=Didymodactylos carnosus TaxID=1234261 RepID=A0A813SZJ0_9BILA|nr:unnamed protein product [Didymodactylos carnosus]CAF3586431.1 unnamed protein product [Didymodactylos carnosus]